MRVADQCDVLVVGAGPAGSTAAQLLASWGWSVVLVHHPAARPSLAESLPSSTRKLFTLLGQLDRVEAAGFHPNDGNVARWAEESRVTPTTDAGFHVSRTAFDRLLRDCARAAQARIVDAVVRRVEPGDPTLVTAVRADDSVVTYAARFVLDCSGRTGVVARRGFRRADARYRTLAIVAEWESEAWPADQRTQTVIESFRDGWAWSVPLSSTRRQCTVMVEPGRSPAWFEPPADRPEDQVLYGARQTIQSIYLRELPHAVELSRRLAGATQTSPAWACDASVYDAVRAADGGVLLVGDAASFIEPLSSAGVKKALLSAWRASVVANTCLRKPALASAALDFYARREQQVYAACMRRTRPFFTEAAAVYATPFWSIRAAYAESAEATVFDDSDALTDEALASDAEVRLAFERLRASEHVRLRVSAALQYQPMASIEGREVVMRDALVVPGLESPLQFAAGVNLAALARLADGHSEVAALLAAYHAEVGPVPLTGLLTGLSLLVARHALVAEAPTP
jgi:flavin-dependent dehydrogenase